MQKTKTTLIVLGLLTIAIQALASGKLALDQTAIEFGTMKEGLVAKKVVRLSNSGDTLLKIVNVTTS